jgi:hypothetical protein
MDVLQRLSRAAGPTFVRRSPRIRGRTIDQVHRRLGIRFGLTAPVPIAIAIMTTMLLRGPPASWITGRQDCSAPANAAAPLTCHGGDAAV